MIKDILFHIGDPKTGSSSIQNALQSRALICDSMTIAPQLEMNASALANSLNPSRNPEKYSQEFRKKAQWAAESEADLGVISAEFFSAVDPEALMKALREFLPTYADSARTIAYVRPHASQFVSSYAQNVKVGAVIGTFKNYVDQRIERQKFIYHPRFDHWQKVFGDRFTLRPFIREEMRDQDVTADFFHEALGGAAFSLVSAETSNESLTLEELAGMRVVQSVLYKRKVPSFLRLSIGGAIGRELAEVSGRSRNKLMLNQKVAKRIMASYLEDARRLDAQFFGGTPMEQALVDAAEKAKPFSQPIRADAYFKKDAIVHLRGLARNLAKLVNKDGKAWRQSYQLNIGQIHDADVMPLDKGREQVSLAVWDVIEQIVQALAIGRVGQGPHGKAKGAAKAKPEKSIRNVSL